MNEPEPQTLETWPMPAEQAFLDRVFERAVEIFEEGRQVHAAELAAGRPNLLEETERLVELARQLTGAGGGVNPAWPSIAGYTILGELGRGGMGAVYLARQENLGGRPVALKVLPPHIAMSARARERFRLEALAIASLSHPNIVRVHDVIHDSSTYAYAMEWVDGRSLLEAIEHVKGVLGTVPSARSRSGAAPSGTRHSRVGASSGPGSATSTHGGARIAALRELLGAPVEAFTEPGWTAFICRVGIAVARALQTVHDAGLIHRDVKPSNILLRRDGAALLSDFGLALDSDGSAITRTEQFLGTPGYAAPEQLRARRDEFDARTDVYALGVTLYHALAFEPPFPRVDPVRHLADVESGRFTPLRQVDHTLPSDLETIVHKAMDASPARRYSSAAELAEDLERLLSLRPIRARPPTSAYLVRRFVARNRLVVAGVAGVLAALTIGVIGTSLGLADALRARRRAELDAWNSRLSEYVAGVLGAASAVRSGNATDARRLLDAAPPEHRGWEWRLLSAQTDQSTAVIPPDSPDGRSRSVSLVTDRLGRRAWMLVGKRIQIRDAATLDLLLERDIATSGWPTIALSPDERRLTLGDGYGGALIVLDSLTLKEVARSDKLSSEIGMAAWSPDGRTLAVCAGAWNARTELDRSVRLLDAESLEQVGLVGPLESRPEWVTFMADGQRLLCSGGLHSGLSIWNVADSRRLDWPDAPAAPVGGCGLSPDGARLAASTLSGLLIFDAVTLGQLAAVDTGSILARAPIWSADSSRLYYSRELQLEGIDTRLGTRVLTLLGSDGPPVAIAALADGRTLLSLDPTGVLRRWNANSVTGHTTWSWFSDAVADHAFNRVAHQAGPRTGDVILREPASGRELRRLQWEPVPPNGGGSAMSFTPDDRYLVKSRDRKRLAVWDLADAAATPAFWRDFQGEKLRSAALLSNDGAEAALAIGSSGIAFVSIPELMPVRPEIRLRESDFTLEGFSPAMGVLIVTSSGTLEFHRLNGTLRWKQKVKDQQTGACLSPDGRFVVTSTDTDSRPGTLQLFDAATGSFIAESAGLPSPALKVFFDATGTRLYAPTREGSLRILGLFRPGPASPPLIRELLSLRVGTGWLAGVSVSSDGSRVLATSDWPATTCWIWDARSEAERSAAVAETPTPPSAP